MCHKTSEVTVTVWVEGFEHRTGEHCASTAMRNIFHFHGLDLSEAMVFGLSSGLGFFSIANDSLSPTRMFHGRTATLELDFCDNTGIAPGGGEQSDDRLAWTDLKAQLDRGVPVMLSTDTYYLGYQNTTSHFPKHRAVAVGYDESAGTCYIADRKLTEYQAVPLEELRRARNAPDYPLSCDNEATYFEGRVRLADPLPAVIRRAIARNAHCMLRPDATPPGMASGIEAMRHVASDLSSWKKLADWSWAARFGYQVIVKRGSGGRFFRCLYAEFMREASAIIGEIGAAHLPERVEAIADRWTDLAAVLEEQSRRDSCSASLFDEAGRIVADLADREEHLFTDLEALCDRDAIWDQPRSGA